MGTTFKHTAFAAALSLCATLAFAAQAQEYQWDLAEEHPQIALPGQMDMRFAEIVAEKSGGRIKITPHFGGAIGFRSPEHLDMVASGAVDLASTPLHTHGGTHPFLEFGSLPFLAQSAENARILFEMAREKYNEVLAPHNQMVVAVSPWPTIGFWSREGITKPEDLQGWTVRTIDLNGQLTLKEAGANPVSMPWSEIIPALTTNAVHGVMSTADAGANIELWQYLKYYTEIGYGWQWHTLHMNLETFNSLPPDLQQIIIETGRELSEQGFERIVQVQAASHDKLKANGVTVITELDPALVEAVEKAGQVAIDRWLERMGPEGQSILAAYREAIK